MQYFEVKIDEMHEWGACTPDFPGMAHSHWKRFMEPSVLVTGFATNP